jgi:hypothetical protein
MELQNTKIARDCPVTLKQDGVERREGKVVLKKRLSGKVREGDGSTTKRVACRCQHMGSKAPWLGPSLFAGSAIELCAGLFQVLMSCVTQETNQRPDYKCFAACMVILRLFAGV